MTIPDTSSAPLPEFALSRTFDAPREFVFRTWTQPEHLANWWGPAGLTMRQCEMDLRPGGVFLYGMKTPDGHELWGKWVFRRVAAPESLEFLVSFCDPQGQPVRHPMAPEWPLEVLSILVLVEQDGRTTLSMTGTPHDATPREREVFAGATGAMAQGWKVTLDNFDAYLAKARSSQS